MHQQLLAEPDLLLELHDLCGERASPVLENCKSVAVAAAFWIQCRRDAIPLGLHKAVN